jgi:hypothetical protein
VPPASVAGALAFTAVETGIESGAGIWGYLFLTGGRGLPAAAAGVAVSAYWAMMCAGRVVLGPAAEKSRPSPRPGRGGRWGAAGGRANGDTRSRRAGSSWADAPRPGRRPGLPVVHADHRDHADGEPAGRGLSRRWRRAPGRPGPVVGPLILAPALLALGLAMAGLYAAITPKHDNAADRVRRSRGT